MFINKNHHPFVVCYHNLIILFAVVWFVHLQAQCKPYTSSIPTKKPRWKCQNVLASDPIHKRRSGRRPTNYAQGLGAPRSARTRSFVIVYNRQLELYHFALLE